MNQHLPHAELVGAIRRLSAAPNKHLALENAAIRLSSFVESGEIAKSDAVDALYNAAEALGLCKSDTDKEVITHVIGSGLSGRLSIPRATRAKMVAGPRIGRLGDLQERHGVTTTVELVCLREILPEPIRWLWQGRLAVGKLTLLSGEVGAGKSQISIDIAARISSGLKWPDGECAEQGAVILLSAEDGLADTVRPRLDAAGADPSRVLALAGVTKTDGTRRTFDLAADLDSLERAIRGLDQTVRLVVVDPITSYMGQIDSHRTTDVRRVLAPLAAFAEKLNVAVLAISHPQKATPAKAIHAVTGSYAYVAAARIVLLATQEPDTDRRLLLPVKSNLAAPANGLGYHLERFIDQSTGIESSRVIWSSDPVTITADEALAASATTGASESAITEAEGFLLDILSDGPLPATDATEKARAAGISEKTLGRAKKKLGVTARKNGFDGHWIWHLADDTSKVAKSREGGQTK